MRLFFERSVQGCRSLPLLRNGSENINRPHQFFVMLNGCHIPGKRFGNLTVPSEAIFALIQQLGSHFLSIIESTAHHHHISDDLCRNLSHVGDFNFCSTQCRKSFLKMLCRVRLCLHVRFVNRKFDNVWFQSFVSGTLLDRYVE